MKIDLTHTAGIRKVEFVQTAIGKAVLGILLMALAIWILIGFTWAIFWVGVACIVLSILQAASGQF